MSAVIAFEIKVHIIFIILETKVHVVTYIVVIVSSIVVFVWSAIAEIAFGLIIVIIVLDVGGGVMCTAVKNFILITGSVTT
jgi:hypothetical protein